MSDSESRQNIKVVCRVRPTNKIEVAKGGVDCVRTTDTTIEVTVTDDKDKKDAQTFAFDRVYDGNSKQNDVFEYIAAPMVKEVLEGYNATVFAYGQTGAGKTYTMQGSDLMDSDHAGIIPRTAKAMFQEIQKDTASSVEVKASFVEIYMEKIRDLLDDTGHKSNLQVREDILRGIYIADVIEFKASSGEDLLDIMARGSKNRAVAATGMNEGSSRSHSVFTINIVKTDKATNIAKSGKLVLVDLAGSETNKKTGTTGQQLKEATMINKSLSALGNVINALTEVSSKAVHIPYRDSKLTRVLQDSLGGNSKTVLMIACSPSSYNAMETISTMRFGIRAKSIENKARVNQSRGVAELEVMLKAAEDKIEELNTEILTLRAQVAVGGGGGGGGGKPSSVGSAGGGGGGGGNSAETIKLLAQLRETTDKQKFQLEELHADSVRKDEQINELYDFLIESEDVLHDAQKVFEEERAELDGIIEQLNLENKLMERTIRRMAATIIKLGGNLQKLEEVPDAPDAAQEY